METLLLAGMILSPVGLIALVLIPVLPVFIARSREFSAMRLAMGYMGAILALAVVVAFSVYISPQEASSQWGVSAEDYWNAIASDFVATLAVATLFVVIGISLFGLPILALLRHFGRATIPWWLGSSLITSLMVASLFFLAIRSSSNATFLGLVGPALVTHAAMALGFGLAAGMPWSVHRR
jgi:hypothetical protein